MFRIKDDIRDINRLRKILLVFFEEGFGYLIEKTGLMSHLPFTKRFAKKFNIVEHPSVHLRRAFEKLGPTFVKFGQLLSLRPDLVPKEYILEFEKMQDRVPCFAYSDVEKLIKKELGKPISQIFKSFDRKPVAAASLGQVHKAKLRNGKVVAVKVQRPDIKKIIDTDIDMMHHIADLLHKHVRELSDYNLVEVVREFERYTHDELNYRIEALNAKNLKKNFEKVDDVYIPNIYSEFTTEKVIVMDFVDGIQINEVEKIKRLKGGYVKVVDRVYSHVITMIFEHGFFHADPHPANILITRDNKIAFIDFGIVGRFDENLRNKSLDIFMSIANGDVDKLVRTFLSLGVVEEKSFDIISFKRDINVLVGNLQYSSLKDIEVSIILEQMMDLALKYKIKLPLDFVLFGKTVITLEGIGLRYNPDFKLIEQTKPLLTKIVRKKFYPQNIKKSVMKTASTYKELLSILPESTLEILQKLRKGELSIDLEDTDIKNLTAEMEHSTGNLSIGMIIAALIVGSALVMQIDTKFKYADMPVISLIGFIIAGILTIWLLHETLFSKIINKNLRLKK
jgi:ubiquinone biosynthesis protein